MTYSLVLGGPGAGKTHRLLAESEAALDGGVLPARVAFVAFTRAAASEAKTKACQRFGIAQTDLPNFRTLHSLAFRELGLSKAHVLGEEHLGELAEATGELLNAAAPSGDGPAMRRNADELLTIDHYCRTTMVSLRTAWEEFGGNVDWYRLKRFSEAYRLFKFDRGLLDFTDMLSSYVETDLNPVAVEVAIIDEAQDLTRLQWAVAEKAFRAAKKVIIAGDDMQSIHKWAGAAEDYFLDLPYDREVLPLSHRLPIEIFNLSEQIAARVSRRFEKQWASSGRTGTVEWINRPEEVDTTKGTWLLLARTRAQMEHLTALARSQGVLYTVKGISSVRQDDVALIVGHEALRAGKRVEGHVCVNVLRAAGVKHKGVNEDSSYTAEELKYDARPIWHDALIRMPLEDREYYLACLRRGEDLRKSPRVRIDTIHGSKGLQAENVLLMTDLTYRTRKGYELDPDSEHRVFYVGITRASQCLYLLTPQTAYGYLM